MPLRAAILGAALALAGITPEDTDAHGVSVPLCGGGTLFLPLRGDGPAPRKKGGDCASPCHALCRPREDRLRKRLPAD